MQIKRKLLLGYLGFQLLTPAVQAQTAPASLSLEQALTRVYQGNPSLWKLRQEQALWQARILQAQLGPNPEWSLISEDFVGSAAFTPDRFTQFTLGLSQTLLLGNKLEYRTRLAQIQQQLAYWDYQLQLQNLGAEVYRVYVNLLNLETESHLLTELVNHAQSQHELLNKAVHAGRLAPTVLLQSEGVVKAFEVEALELALQAKTLKQDLALLWGSPEVDFSRLSGTLPLTGWGDLEQLEKRLQSHPRLARWELENQHRQDALSAAQAQAIPDLNVSGGVRYHPPLEWGLVLSLGLPWGVVNNNQGPIAEARLRNESWKKEQALEYAQMRGLLRKALAQAEGQAALSKQIQAHIQLAEARQEAAHKAFTAGKTGYLEWLTASQNLAELRRRLVQAHSQRLLAVVEILSLTQNLWPESLMPMEAHHDLSR